LTCAGDRIQLHRNGNDIQYYSRRGVEHGEYSGFTVMDTVVKKQLKHEKCILDGEMIVWNKTR
jgi:DNA ligase-4